MLLWLCISSSIRANTFHRIFLFLANCISKLNILILTINKQQKTLHNDFQTQLYLPYRTCDWCHFDNYMLSTRTAQIKNHIM
jgi:hypothetical protein